MLSRSGAGAGGIRHLNRVQSSNHGDQLMLDACAATRLGSVQDFYCDVFVFKAAVSAAST